MVVIGLRYTCKVRIFLEKQGRNSFIGLKAKCQRVTTKVLGSVLRPLGFVTVLITSCRPSSDLVLKPATRLQLRSINYRLTKRTVE